MIFAKLALATGLTLAATGFAAAQQDAIFDDLDADRINANQVSIEFEYDGGACDRVGPAQLGETEGGILSVTFPVATEGDVCTQQIVEVEVEQVIEADQSVTGPNISLLRPDGSVLGTALETIDNDD